MSSKAEYWDLMVSFFEETQLVHQHLDSFNDFIDFRLQQIIDEVGEIQPEIPRKSGIKQIGRYYLKLGKVRIGKPSIREADGSKTKIFPNEARIRDLTYSAPIELTVIPVDRDEKTGIEEHGKPENVYIGELPIMLKSKACLLYNLKNEKLIENGEDPRDPGGYFIINGSERVLVTQEDLAPNRVLVEEARHSSTSSHIAKVFSTSRGFRAPVQLERRRDSSLHVTFPSVPGRIPLAILMRALGFTKDREIAFAISRDPDIQSELRMTLEAASPLYDPKSDTETQENALDYIGKRVAVGQTREYRIQRAQQVLDRYLLPHIGRIDKDRKRKAYFLAQMADRLLQLVTDKRIPDDKDHYSNKRLKLAGDLLTSLFRVAFLNLFRDIKYQLERAAMRGRKPNIKTAVRADVITERLRHALATGNWVGGKAGVSQLLDRTNYLSSLSHLRRVVSPLSRSQPHFEARDLHPTHYGRICLVPDSQVLLGDGINQKEIGLMDWDYRKTSVLTVDRASHKEIPSKLSDLQRFSAYELGKTVIEIKTKTNRAIRATEDHPFLTEGGWVEAGKLQRGEKVLIRPILNKIKDIESNHYSPYIIIDEVTFLNGAWKTSLPKKEHHLLEKDLRILKDLGLIPLYSNHPQLPIIARLFGAIITDGSVTNTVEFYLGTREDAVAVNEDIKTLGFESNPITKKLGIIIDRTGHRVESRTFLTTKGGAFKRLMMALGTPYGKRTEQPSTFPSWLLNTPKIVKREFLGAYMGGDGCAPRISWSTKQKKNSKVGIDEITNNKHPEYVDSQVLFFRHVSQLLKEFGIQIKNINTKEIRKDRIQVELILSQAQDNIHKICKNIGYRYCKEKQYKSQIFGEYLDYRQAQISKRRRDRKVILELYRLGFPQREIAKELNLSYRTITSTIQRRTQKRRVIRPKSTLSVTEFFKETKANPQTGMLYVPISTLRETSDDLVCDFTTIEDTHSFVANGFVTHNCPNETPEGPNCVLPDSRISIPGGSTITIGELEKDELWRSTRLMSATWQVPHNRKVNIIHPPIARFIKNKANGTPFKLHHIETNTGRTVTTTADHPFQTNNGLIEARNLKPGMKVAVIPAALERPDWSLIANNHETVLDEDDIRNVAHPRSNVEHHINILKNLGLIPLKKDNSKYRVLLRLLGFFYGDGHLSIRTRRRKGGSSPVVTACFIGQIDDLNDLKSDLTMLGFKTSSIKSFKATSILPDRIISGITSQFRCEQKAFWLLMKALGAPIGDKQTQQFKIPPWLKNASRPEIREFLAALFGCELHKPTVDRRNDKVFVSPELKMSKEIGLLPSLKEFYIDIKRMSEKLGLTFPPKSIRKKEQFTRKDGTTTQKLSLCFSGSVDNLVKLYGSIGYIYNRKREKLAQITYAYLKNHIVSRDKRRKAAKYILSKAPSMKGTPTEKAKLLLKELERQGLREYLRLHDPVNWIKTNADPSIVRVSAHDTPSFVEWVVLNTLGLNGDAGLVWETIKSNRLDISGTDTVVEDVTLDSRFHKLFVNGFYQKNCGLVKNLALMAHISVGTDEVSVESLLYGLGVEPVEAVRGGGAVLGAAVFLNGRLIGYHGAPGKLVRDVRSRRRRGEVDPEVNVTWHGVFNEVQVNCDAGRVRRPLMVVDGGKTRLKPDSLRRVRDGDLTFNSMIKQGMVEYLDTEEEENALVAMHEVDLRPEHTHLEIAPSTILGICASVIPYPEHNQSPRNTYEAGMAKQALGVPMANFKLRLDTRSHLLHYPQKPIVNTSAMDVIGFDRRPAGQNFVIAILSYEGYNMEDALVMNKSSIERGLARSTFFRNYRAEERRYPGGQEDHFEIPDKNVRGYRESDRYRHLGEDGIIEPEVKLNGGEVLIGRTSPPRFLEEYREFDMTVPTRRETSVDMRHGEEGIVDMVMLSETVDGNRLVKIKVRDQRQPELGDKFASRHGQKGVIGLLVPQEDMPFTEMGIVPDLILNPHAIPSRMTLGQTFESVSGKAGAAHGTMMDGTAFRGLPLEELGRMLQKGGFKYNGQEVMYNGMTGEKFNADIFTGLVYYQKLHHLVRDKMHARARGPVQILTRQPTEGRAREGGLRFGEMERDCLIGHGAALLLKERLLEESDKSKVLICTRCGLLAVHDRNRDRYYCHICEDKGTIAKVVMSYAFKLLLQELMSLGIAPRLQLKDMA